MTQVALESESTRAKAQENAPMLGEFLSFPARDMQASPEKIEPLSASMRTSVDELIEGV